MTLSPMVAKWAAAYEREYGHKPSKQVLRITEHLQKVCEMLKERGQKDAQQGKGAYPANVFPAMAAKAFRLDMEEDQETVQAVADLWQAYYMKAYNSVKGELQDV